MSNGREKKSLYKRLRGKLKKYRLMRLFRFGVKDPKRIAKAIFIFSTKGPSGLGQRMKRWEQFQAYSIYINDQYINWLERYYPKKNQLKLQENESLKFKARPKISLITPTFNSDEKYLSECIKSVLNQSYGNWELCIADDASKDSRVRDLIIRFAKKDKRIKYFFRSENGHISKASNSALELADGDYVALLDHDDFLWPNALYETVKLLNKFPKAEFIYTDEDKLAEDGKSHVESFFKPEWSPDYLRSINYITHFAVMKKDLIKSIGGFREGYEGAQDWDLFLRITREISKKADFRKRILHIPKILYSWRKAETSAASAKAAIKFKGYAFVNQEKVLEDDLAVRNVKGRILHTPILGSWRIKYEILGNPLVSIIIPTKDQFFYIEKCLESILNKSTYQNFELIIVDTGSKDVKVKKLYQTFKRKRKKTKIIYWKDKAFNFSKACNFGANRSEGEYLLFLNNDTEVITGDWIESMLEHAQRDDIGAVGPKMLYPGGIIQNAGIVTGVTGTAAHIMKGFYDSTPQPFPMVLAKDSIRNVAAVTGACMMIKTKNFNKLGGFDESFRIAYNDVDLCLRCFYDLGLYNLFTPYAKLYHHENVSTGNPFAGTRDFAEFLEERKGILNKWGKKLTEDPFYNSNLTLEKEDFSLK